MGLSLATDLLQDDDELCVEFPALLLRDFVEPGLQEKGDFGVESDVGRRRLEFGREIIDMVGTTKSTEENYISKCETEPLVTEFRYATVCEPPMEGALDLGRVKREEVME